MKRLVGLAILLAGLGLASPGTGQTPNPPARAGSDGFSLGGGITDPLPREELEGLRLGASLEDTRDRLERAGLHITLRDAAGQDGKVAILAARRELGNDALLLLFCGGRLYDMSRRTPIGPEESPALDILYYGDGINYGHRIRYERPAASGAPWWWETRTWDRHLCFE